MYMPKFMITGPMVQTVGWGYRQTNGTVGNIYRCRTIGPLS